MLNLFCILTHKGRNEPDHLTNSDHSTTIIVHGTAPHKSKTPRETSRNLEETTVLMSAEGVWARVFQRDKDTAFDAR